MADENHTGLAIILVSSCSEVLWTRSAVMESPSRGQSSKHWRGSRWLQMEEMVDTHGPNINTTPQLAFLEVFLSYSRQIPQTTVEGSLHFYAYRKNSEYLQPEVLECALAERLPVAQTLSCAFLLSAVPGGLSMLQETAGHNGFWFSLVSNSDALFISPKTSIALCWNITAPQFTTPMVLFQLWS